MKIAAFTLAAIMLASPPAASAVRSVAAGLKSCREQCFATCKVVLEGVDDLVSRDCKVKCALKCNFKGVRPVVPGTSPANQTLSPVLATDKKSKRRDRRTRKKKAPKGYRWVQKPDGSLVAVPLGATALIRQGTGLKCRCRKSGEDKCTAGVESDGKTAFCGNNAPGSCGTGDTCVFKGTSTPDLQLQFPQGPRVVQ